MARLHRTGSALVWALLLGLLVGGLAYWAVGPGATSIIREKEGIGGNQIVMTDVEIEAFDERFNRTTLLAGKRATTFKDSSDLVIEPCDGTIFREPGKDVKVKAQRVQKIVNRGAERFEFTGEVEVWNEGRKLLSEKLIYLPSFRTLESGAPVQILTTGTSILAKSLKTQTDIKTGTLEGEVQITSVGDGPRAYDVPIRISGQRSDFDLPRGLFDVAGTAWAKKELADVHAAKITYNRRRRTLTADGNSVARRPNLTVHAGHLEYWLDREAGIATQGPKAVQFTPATTNENESRSELSGQVIELDFRREILEARDEVCLQRFVKFEGDWEPDYKITARSVTSLYGRKRSTFRGDVRIDTDKLGAVGDRAIFYQTSSKMYVVGHARAWDFDEDRNRQNEISGEQIVHDLKTGRSQVLEGVRSRFKETTGRTNGRTEREPAPERSPRSGRVQMIFKEGADR